MNQNPDTSFQYLVRAFRRRWYVLVGLTLVAAGAAALVAGSQPKEYTATAALLFRDPQLDQRLFGSTFITSSPDPERQARTNLRLVTLRTVADRTAARLGDGFTTSRVADSIEVNETRESDVAEVDATDRDPQEAARIANTFAEEYIAFRTEADRSKIVRARNLLLQQYERLTEASQVGEQGRALQDRAEQLGVFAELQTGNAELVETAKAPTDPSAPHPMRSGVIGGVLGLIFAIGVVLLVARLDRRIRDLSSFEEVVHRPVLAVVPDSKALSRQQRQRTELPPAESEAFRILRARLRYFNVDREITTILVTSSAPGEGKSTVCVNLAAAAAASGQRVALVEADLRKPTLGSALGTENRPGLSDLLSSAIGDVRGVLSTIDAGGESERPYLFDFLPAGNVPPNPAELLESHTFSDLLKTLSDSYDLVVIDSAPTPVVSDALPLISQVDGVIIVSRVNFTTRDAIRRLQHQFDELGAPVLGYVLNGLRDASTSGYAYAYSHEATVPVSARATSRSNGPH